MLQEEAIRVAFKQGELVVCSPHGVGTIQGVESKGGCPCFIISFQSGLKVFIPTENAERMLRPLMSRNEAENDLGILRGEWAQVDGRKHREIREDRSRILRVGSRTERASVLRSLYASNTPASDSVASAIRAFEDVVLEEISLALGVARESLETEMRERYPVLSKKKKAAAAK